MFLLRFIAVDAQ